MLLVLKLAVSLRLLNLMTPLYKAYTKLSHLYTPQNHAFWFYRDLLTALSGIVKKIAPKCSVSVLEN